MNYLYRRNQHPGFLARLRTIRFGALARGSAFMGMAEMGNRLSRIVTAIVLARMLSTSEFGMMALVLTTYELVRMLIANGFGARIVQAAPEELDEVCTIVWRLNWVVGGLMALAQVAVAWPVQQIFHTDVAFMLVVLGSVHVIYPLGMVHGCLAQRNNQLGFTATLLFFQVTVDNLGTAAMVLLGYGVWGAVIPKVIIAVLWVGIHLVYVKGWARGPVTRAKAWTVIGYSRCVLAAETLNTLRAHGDKLIVGKALGLESFGIYSFAANAGGGLAANLASALGQAALPYLASSNGSQNDLKGRFKTTIRVMLLVIVPIVAVQVMFAPFYVPLVFGEKWTPAVPALMLMCMAALARPFAVATTQLLRAIGAVDQELRNSQWNALLFFLALAIGLPFGVEGVAFTLLVASIAPTLVFARQALARIDSDAAAKNENAAFSSPPALTLETRHVL